MKEASVLKHAFEIAQNIFVTPIQHHQLGYAFELRRAFFETQPDVVAVELPVELDEEIHHCVKSLPVLNFVMTRHRNRAEYLSIDPGDARIEALRMARQYGVTVEFVDSISRRALRPESDSWQVMPDPWAIDQVGCGAVCEELIDKTDLTLSNRYLTAEFVERVLSARNDNERVLVVCHGILVRGLHEAIGEHERGVAKEKWTVSASGPIAENPATDIQSETRFPRAAELPFLLGEMPAITFAWERHRRFAGDDEPFMIDRALEELVNDSVHRYEEAYDEFISLTDLRSFYQYGKNLSLINNRIRPGLYEMIIAARGCFGDDYAAMLLDVLTTWPPLDDDETTWSDHYRSHDLYHKFDDETEKVQSHYPRPDMTTLEFKFKRRQFSEQQKEAWKLQFEMSGLWGICSWPPEDVLIEKFFDHVRKRALNQITDEHSAVEEFTTSILDGLDLRETIRHWHDNKIYVKRERKPPGKVGPVVLVWKDTPLQGPEWKTTLYAENNNESDIAFCASPKGDEMIGPQISRSTYHSIMSVYPSMGIPDIWQYPGLQGWGTSYRLLTASAILLSEERFVAIIAPEPPDGDLVEFARQHSRALLYLPIGTFSRKTLRRLRQFHILNGKQVRDWAGDYIEDTN